MLWDPKDRPRQLHTEMLLPNQCLPSWQVCPGAQALAQLIRTLIIHVGG